MAKLEFFGGLTRAIANALYALRTRNINTSGAALSGGGNLTADRTITLSESPNSASVVGTGRTIGTSGAALSGGGDLSADRTITLSESPNSASVVGTGRAVNTSGAALSGGGDLSADRTITLSESPNSASVVGTGRTIGTSGAALSGGGDLSADRTITLSESPNSASVVGTGRTITAGTGLTGGGDLSADRTVTLSTPVTVANGGTGASSFTAHGVIIGNDSSALSVTATGSAGEVLTSNGSSADPTFQAASTGPTKTAVNQNYTSTSSPVDIFDQTWSTGVLGELSMDFVSGSSVDWVVTWYYVTSGGSSDQNFGTLQGVNVVKLDMGVGRETGGSGSGLRRPVNRVKVTITDSSGGSHGTINLALCAIG